MIVGTCQISFLIPDSRSLKERRRVLNALKTRLRGRFNISLCELDSQRNWKRGILGVAAVGSTRRFTNEILSKVVQFAENDPRIEIVDYEMDIF